MNFDRQVIKPPERGSFPLDHFHECNTDAEKYTKCLKKHKLMPKRCRKFQINYLECRMKYQLMEDTQLEDLGLDEKMSWENEKQEKRETYKKIMNLKRQAFENVLRERRRQDIANKPDDFPDELL